MRPIDILTISTSSFAHDIPRPAILVKQSLTSTTFKRQSLAIYDVAIPININLCHTKSPSLAQVLDET